MKKIIVWFLTFVLLASFAACGTTDVEDTAESTPQDLTPEPTLEPIPESTLETPPETITEPTPKSIESRQDLLDIGFIIPNGAQNIYIGKTNECLSSALFELEDDYIADQQEIMIDFNHKRINISNWGSMLEDEYFDEEYWYEYENKDTWRYSNGYDFIFDSEMLKSAVVKIDMRVWYVFLLNEKDDLGFAFIPKKLIRKEDPVIDGYVIFTDMQQDGYKAPHDLRTKFGMAGLNEDITEKAVAEAKAQYETAKQIVETSFRLTIEELLFLE